MLRRAITLPAKPYFAGPRPRVLAHRGLATSTPENTIAAFAAAIEAGASYIETDVHATSDGICVIAHDDDLLRVAGRVGKVRDLTLDQLQAIELGQGETFATLQQALEYFPTARFNIDIKSMDAAAPAIAAITAASAIDRVLVTSFSERRRKRVVDGLPGVATSASAALFAAAFIAAQLRVAPVLKLILRPVDAVQIPERALGMRTSSPRLITAFQRASVEVHFWTINRVDDMTRLVHNGADGVVSDRADLAVKALKNR